jgi:hypothetical protein
LTTDRENVLYQFTATWDEKIEIQTQDARQGSIYIGDISQFTEIVQAIKNISTSHFGYDKGYQYKATLGGGMSFSMLRDTASYMLGERR